jgi:hypothetical protein
MMEFINKFKIPTLAGLGIIMLGLLAGVYLILREQIFFSQASPNTSINDITTSNITEDSATISFRTNPSAPSFVTYGTQNPKEQTALDERDKGKPSSRGLHYVTLNNLLPQTDYQFKVYAGKNSSDTLKFTTSNSLVNPNQLPPVIGSVLKEDNTPLNEGIVYLSFSDAVTVSSLVKAGNFLIPIAQIDIAEDSKAKLTIISDLGESTALVKLTQSSKPLPPLKLGQNVDITEQPTSQPSPSTDDLSKYDLYVDGKINSADNAVILDNLGRNPKNKKADLNKDGTVDKKDLELMSQKLTELGLQ